MPLRVWRPAQPVSRASRFLRKYNRKIVRLLLTALFCCACVVSSGQAPARQPGTYATIHTSMGDIVIQLFEKEAPKAVANFVGLATGKKEWTDPRTQQKSNKPLFDGTTFHRVIPFFM